MRLDNNEIFNFLSDRGVVSLHHANSLATSLTFLQNNGLLSRGFIETNRLFQTRQLSDDDDRKFNVWNDIFFDSRDLHGYFPRQNLYGPILFKFNLRLLLQEDLQIYVTKNNPMFWNDDISEEDKYFLNMEDIRNNWDRYLLQRKMITIRFPDSPINFNYLENIIVDNPGVFIYGNIDPFAEAWRSLTTQLMENSNLRDLLVVRECLNCYCKENYLNQYSVQTLAKFFLPNSHPQFSNI